jgi:hypothetical protein
LAVFAVIAAPRRWSLAVVTLAAALAACGAVGESGANRHPVEDRVLLRAFQSKGNGDSAIVLERDKELLPSGCEVTVLIDKRPVVAIDAGEVFTAYVEPAAHRVEARFARKCEARRAALSVMTHAGKAVHVRVRYASLSAPTLEELGERELER